MKELTSGYFILKVEGGAMMKLIVWGGVRQDWDLPRPGRRLPHMEACCQPTRRPTLTSMIGM